MSFINFSLTHRFDGGGIAQVLPRSETLSTGFSREGGRVEFVRQSEQSDPLGAPRTYEAKLTKAVEGAASGVRDALQAGSWVQDIEVQHGDGAQPDVVSWTYRNGGGETGLAGSLPAPIQAVLDAAEHLGDVTTAQLVNDGS
jgi:hypothetical protein